MARHFDNQRHYFYYCRKIMRTNIGEISEKSEKEMHRVTQILYEFWENNEAKLKELGARRPIDLFSYRLSGCQNHREIKQLLLSVPEILGVYENILIMDRLLFAKSDYYEEYGLPSRSIDWLKETITIKSKGKVVLEPLEETTQLLFGLYGQVGIYRLYDENKNLIYIGKSYNLCDRIPSSANSKKAHYFSYCVLNNKADTDIYELYYINKLKPPKNLDGGHDDTPSTVLPELIFTNILPLYNNEKEAI